MTGAAGRRHPFLTARRLLPPARCQWMSSEAKPAAPGAVCAGGMLSRTPRLCSAQSKPELPGWQKGDIPTAVLLQARLLARELHTPVPGETLTPGSRCHVGSGVRARQNCPCARRAPGMRRLRGGSAVGDHDFGFCHHAPSH